MKIKVNKNEVSIEYENGEVINRGEYKVHKCYFEFSEEYQELTKKAIFETSMTKKEMPIIDDVCDIPYEVLNSERINLRVYAYSVENDDLILRYSPRYGEFCTLDGSYIDGAEPSEEVTPTQFEQYTDALNKGLNEVNETLKVVEDNESERVTTEIARNKAVENAIEKITDLTDKYNENASQKTKMYNDNASSKTQQLESIADGVKDMATAIQVPTWYIDEDLNLHQVTIEKLGNLSFYINDDLDFVERIVI